MMKMNRNILVAINFENKKDVVMGYMNINVLKYGSHDLTDT